MPWKDNRVEQQRLLMMQDYEEGASISELAEVYGISRKTVYKWLDHRFSRILPRELKKQNLLNETKIDATQAVTGELHLSAATAQPQA